MTTSNKQAIANSFSAAAATYDQAAYIEQEIGTRLIERLTYIKIQPLKILDLGCGTGYFTQRLQQLFPQASIIGVDLALGMAKYASKKRAAEGINYCCADAEQLPFSDQYFDLIFSNCCFMAANDLLRLSTELKRILSSNGLLLFTTLGPDTLIELGLTDNWLDMHNVGDIFLKAQFTNPVVDTEIIKLSYSSLEGLLMDLQESGSYQIGDITQIDNLQQAFTASFEVIYGIAWGNSAPKLQSTNRDGKIIIPIEQIEYFNR